MGYQDSREKRRQATALASSGAMAQAFLTVTAADLTAAASTQAFPFAVALPATAVVLGVRFDVTIGFTDGASGVFEGLLGEAGRVDFMLDKGIATSGIVAALEAGALGFVGAVTPILTISADVDVNTATVGSLIAGITYAA